MKVEKQDDYLPFGMEISQGNIANPKNEYLYNRKELQESTGLYDYGARFYDPVVGRWTSVDPLAEINRRFSPYNYVENDPVKNIDPDGMDVDLGTVGGGNIYLEGEAAQNYFSQLQGQQPTPKKKKQQESDRYKLPASVTKWQIFKNFLFGTPIPGVPSSNVQDVAVGDNPLGWLVEGGGIEGLADLFGSSSVWALDASARGFAIEQMLGGNLPYGFPAIDKFADGVATSIKSIDLTSQSYSAGNTLLNTLRGYIRSIAGFQGGARGGLIINGGDITSKVLEVALQKGKASSQQLEQIGKAIQYAKANGVKMIVKYIK